MKLLILLMTIISTSLYGADCLESSERYFKDLDGELDYVSGQTKPVKVFSVYKEFKGEYPIKASFNIESKKDCKVGKLATVSLFRFIGKNKFSGKNGEHKSHNKRKAILGFWDKTPIVKKEVTVVKAGNLLTMGEFKINEIVEKLNDNQHVWKFRVEVKFKNRAKKVSTIIDSKLLH